VKSRPRSIPTLTDFPLSWSDGFESDYAGLTGYFASIHAAFDDRKITRRSVVAEGRTVPSRRGSRLAARASSPSPPPTRFPRSVADARRAAVISTPDLGVSAVADDVLSVASVGADACQLAQGPAV
jgi:hypothetical protein